MVLPAGRVLYEVLEMGRFRELSGASNLIGGIHILRISLHDQWHPAGDKRNVRYIGSSSGKDHKPMNKDWKCSVVES